MYGMAWYGMVCKTKERNAEQSRKNHGNSTSFTKPFIMLFAFYYPIATWKAYCSCFMPILSFALTNFKFNNDGFHSSSLFFLPLFFLLFILELKRCVQQIVCDYSEVRSTMNVGQFLRGSDWNHLWFMFALVESIIALTHSHRLWSMEFERKKKQKQWSFIIGEVTPKHGTTRNPYFIRCSVWQRRSEKNKKETSS